MKTLFVSDLDGTLLNNKGRLSKYTIKVINSFISNGGNFTIATARSYTSTYNLIKELNINLPIITYNGAGIFDVIKLKYCDTIFFNDEDNRQIKEVFLKNNIIPNIHSLKQNNEKVYLLLDKNNKGQEYYIKSRKNDNRFQFVYDLKDLFDNESNIFSYLGIGNKENLTKIYNILNKNEKLNCIFYKEIYSGDYWLDIYPKIVTKSNSIIKLKKKLSFDKVIVFGDGSNDISMFNISDKCFAVENAVSKLKEIATGVLESNDNDGVAKWINRNAILYK